MKKTTMFGIFALLVLCLAAAGAFAMGFGGKGKMNHFGNNDALKAALQGGDYTAYINALQAANMTQKLQGMTQEKFNSIVQRYKDTAAMQESRQKIEQAIQNNDFGSWSSAMNEMIAKQQAQITKENFDRIVQMHQNMQNKNMTGMKHHGFGRKMISE